MSAATLTWEKTFKSKLEALLQESFKDDNTLSEELKTYAIKKHLIEDITSFVQNEKCILQHKIEKLDADQLQSKIDEIVARKNFFYVGYMKEISYDLWTVAPPSDQDRWKTYVRRHQGGEKMLTSYAHVTESVDHTVSSLIEINVGKKFCLNENAKDGVTKQLTRDKGVVYVLEYRYHSYNVMVVGDCLLNGVKANQLHDIHKTDVVVYPRATMGDLLKSYLKQIIRQNPNVVILHIGTYDITIGRPDSVKNLKEFCEKIQEKNPDIIIAVSSILTRVDKKGVKASVKTLNSQFEKFCKEADVCFINNDNIGDEFLCQRMLLTLNKDGRSILSKNLSCFIESLI